MNDWQVSTVVSQTRHSDSARSLRLALSEPFRAVPGQHLDIRLTAEDGYSTARTYSVSDARESRTIEVTVERADDGEVSPYLVDVVEVGEPLEVTRPHGGWFTWDGSRSDPVQLIAGGSGLGPLMSMLRHREIASPTSVFNLVYSLRSPDRMLFADDLRQLTQHRRLPVHLVYTRRGPETDPRPTGRLGAAEIAELTIGPEEAPTVFICGPTAFVEHCAAAMIDAGHARERIRTERFG
ncbi:MULTISPECIES: FAD-binding oxidoreductase [Gordonia]|uniref:FAD-binding oxidoreductase n=2 Tax=Gordonia TaxID=2053 RepID=A0A9X3I5Q1_9ACTN|nr:MULTISPECIES: FAD-binding oxidoreductase [Gordonia]MCF3937653.1 FAD-binding oxidoreductase [Gordonia tangerina]MCX2966043.1 FAD-binding oxidoreductase [Gordonia aquimaris]